jgi:hypothetical protein
LRLLFTMAFHAEDGILKTDDKGYNPRIGTKYGRVGKDDFSIDGKSWNYRDPHNQDHIRRQNIGNEREHSTISEHSSSMTNALYDYSYGQVRDAAKTLGIGNVNDKSEVTSIIDQIQNGSKKQEEEKIQTVKKPEPTEPKKPYMVNVTEGEKNSKAYVEAYNNSMMGQGPGLSSNAVNPTAGMKGNTAQESQAAGLATTFKEKIKQDGLQLSQFKQTVQDNKAAMPDQRVAGSNDYFDKDAYDQYVKDEQEKDKQDEEEN